MLRRLKGYARFLLGLAMAYALYRFWSAPVWDWSGQMSITGNRLVTRQELLDRLEVTKKTPLYRLNPQYISTQLEGVPAIARVAVRRWLFPARLELNVIERQALVQVADDHPGADPTPTPAPHATPTPSADKPSAAPSVPPQDTTPRRWIDQEGVVFAAPPKLMSPRFGIQVHTDLPPGSHLPAAVQTHLFELLNAWPHDQEGRLDLRNPNDVYASIGGWPVRLGEVDDVALKFAMFQHLEPLATKYKDRLKYINLRFPSSPTLVLKTGAEIKPSDHAAEKAPASPVTDQEVASPLPSPSAPSPHPSPKPSAKPTHH